MNGDREPAAALALQLRSGRSPGGRGGEAGLVFVSVSTGKFADHAVEAVDFERWRAIPDVAVCAVGSWSWCAGSCSLPAS